MNSSSFLGYSYRQVFIAVVAVNFLLANPATTRADDATAGFDGPKTLWHGFDRYDFTIDPLTMEINPSVAPVTEGDVTDGDTSEKIPCIVVAPKRAAVGHLWSWRGDYWDHEPQAEIELLNRGFFIVYVNHNPGSTWDAWYSFLVNKHGFSKKPAFVGMSKGGVYAYQWAVGHPDQVGCIYADNPALYPQDLEKVHLLAEADVPLLHVCGSFDYLLPHHTLQVESMYHQLGGRITVMIKEGSPHHPHSLLDAKPIADWIEQNVQAPSGEGFSLPATPLVKSHFYSFANTFAFYPNDQLYITCRGPGFTECYARYDVEEKDWSLTGATFILPKSAAPGNPWVFRADRIDPSEPSPVDLGLLAKGFTIVAAPLDTQAGPTAQQWNETYRLMIQKGYAKRPALEGFGAGAGEAYAWALNNSDKVSCIYADNPLFQSVMYPKLSFDNLVPLYDAQIPLLHVCGSFDPLLKENSEKVEQNYKKLGGHITVILENGVGHYPLGPNDPQPVINFIASAAGQ
jgi:pimeloyl-ACP methyl ester carboxylesterase